MMKSATFAFVLLIATGATAADTPSLDPSLGVVFVGEKSRELLHQTCLQVPNNVTSTWTPAPDQIRELESRLPSALAKENPGWMHDVGLNFARQYGGVEIRGRRLIYINAFPVGLTRYPVKGMPPEFHYPDWHTIAVGMCDSGAVFGALYDPNSERFSNFSFETPYK